MRHRGEYDEIYIACFHDEGRGKVLGTGFRAWARTPPPYGAGSTRSFANMAKEGRKLELYEILAAKRAKGKPPIGVEAKPARQANMPEPEVTDAPGLIVDDAVSAHVNLKARAGSAETEPPPANRPTWRPATENIDQKTAEPETKENVPIESAEPGAAVTPTEPDVTADVNNRQNPAPEAALPPAGTVNALPPGGGETIVGNNLGATASYPATSANPYNPHSSFNIPASQPLPPAPGWFGGKRFDSGKMEPKAAPPPRRQERSAAPPAQEFPEPAPEPRVKSPREVVFALDTALICFTVILALVGSSYFIGYKRGQEERPAGLAGIADIETADPNRVGIRNLTPPPRAAFRPPETDYTLVIRIEPATDELPERLELELAEALARGRKEIGREIPGFIFRTQGADPHYILAVGLGQSVTDQELNRLLQIYNVMEGINLSRQPRPYIGCRIAPIRELGVAVY